LTQDEIAELRAQGCTPQEIIDKQIERHQAFDLKTDFSKEKWRKRKEKKWDFIYTYTPDLRVLMLCLDFTKQSTL
jgi:hypothetical protein